MTFEHPGTDLPIQIPIADPDDPRIAAFRDIRERDLTGRSGFIAEGTVVLDQLALSSRFRPTSLLVLRNRLDGISTRIARLPADCPVYVAERDVLDAIAGFPMHRGVVAHGIDTMPQRTAREAVAGSAKPSGPLLVGVGIANHDNVGALFRNARAFGVRTVLLDETSCNPLYRKALRVSVGTVLTQEWHRGGPVMSLVATVLEAGYQPVALSPRAEISLADLDTRKSYALFVGAEGAGLPQEILNEMACLKISMEPDVDSLNVATSAAIVLARLYEGSQRFS